MSSTNSPLQPLVDGPFPAEFVPRREGIARADPHCQVLEAAHHAFICAKIPYLPTAEHLQTIQQPDFTAREIFRRFVVLTETIAALNPWQAVGLRMTNEPTTQPVYPRLNLRLLLKSADEDPGGAAKDVIALWEIVKNAFPSEFPYGYPLLADDMEQVSRMRASFSSGRVKHVIEFTKFWDTGYARREAFPHPYRQSPALHALLPLFSALASAPQRVSLTIALRPSGLVRNQELIELLREFSIGNEENEEYQENRIDAARRIDQHRSSGAVSREAAELRRQDRAAMRREDERLRARLGSIVADSLLRHHDRLLDMNVSLACWDPSPPMGVVEAVRAVLNGESLFGAAGESVYTSLPRADWFHPKDPLYQRKIDDLIWLEHHSSVEPPNLAWRTLVTPEEAVSLFSLPMPPELGQVPGVISQSQPFFLPIEFKPESTAEEEGPVLGYILDRGEPTSYQARIPLNKLDQHILIAGRSGSGKTNSTLVLLLELTRLGIPFLVLDPLDKGDYRLLLADGLMTEDSFPWQGVRKEGRRLNETLHVYTLGEKTSPLVFNPFRVPPGVTVQKHVSQLLRCFLTAFIVGDPVPALYRAALRRVYLDLGWGLEDVGETLGKHAPTFLRFYQTLERIVEERSVEYSAEIRGNIRQMTRLRIGSLLEDNAGIFNICPGDDRDPFHHLVHYPTVFELGHIGSDEDKALIMAFLVTCLVPYIQKRQQRSVPHITVIEEAHRLMRRGADSSSSPRGDFTGQTRTDFSNLLAEVRGYNQGIIVADQSPSELVSSVFSNTATHIMHQIRDPLSFEMMAGAFVLAPSQVNYSRRLKVGEAIAETALGTPMHVKAHNVSGALKRALSQSSLPEGIPYFDPDADSQVVCNKALKAIMARRSIPMPEANEVNDAEIFVPRPSNQSSPSSAQPAARPAASTKGPYPEQCKHCRPLKAKGGCLYMQRVMQFREDKNNRLQVELEIAKVVEQGSSISPEVSVKMREVHDRFSKLIQYSSNEELDDLFYCEAAHLAAGVANHSTRKSYNGCYMDLLAKLHGWLAME